MGTYMCNTRIIYILLMSKDYVEITYQWLKGAYVKSSKKNSLKDLECACYLLSLKGKGKTLFFFLILQSLKGNIEFWFILGRNYFLLAVVLLKFVCIIWFYICFLKISNKNIGKITKKKRRRRTRRRQD